MRVLSDIWDTRLVPSTDDPDDPDSPPTPEPPSDQEAFDTWVDHLWYGSDLNLTDRRFFTLRVVNALCQEIDANSTVSKLLELPQQYFTNCWILDNNPDKNLDPAEIGEATKTRPLRRRFRLRGGGNDEPDVVPIPLSRLLAENPGIPVCGRALDAQYSQMPKERLVTLVKSTVSFIEVIDEEDPERAPSLMAARDFLGSEFLPLLLRSQETDRLLIPPKLAGVYQSALVGSAFRIGTECDSRVAKDIADMAMDFGTILVGLYSTPFGLSLSTFRALESDASRSLFRNLFDRSSSD